MIPHKRSAQSLGRKGLPLLVKPWMMKSVASLEDSELRSAMRRAGFQTVRVGWLLLQHTICRYLTEYERGNKAVPAIFYCSRIGKLLEVQSSSYCLSFFSPASWQQRLIPTAISKEAAHAKSSLPYSAMNEPMVLRPARSQVQGWRIRNA